MKTLKYKNYLGSIDPDVDAGVLHGKILYINDLVTFEGDTVADLRKAFEESVDDYLAVCAEFGDEPDAPFSGSFNVRIGESLHRQSVLAAAERDIKLNDLVKRALACYLKPKDENHIHYHVTEPTVVASQAFDAIEESQEWQQTQPATQH